MFKLMKNEGITLIALVITIVVLIILAGVSINLLFGENGIIQKSVQGKEDYLKAKYEEDIELTIAEAFADRDDEENIEKAYIEVVKEKIASKNFDWINGEIIMCDDELEEHQDTETDSISLNTLLLIPTKDGYEIRVRVENDITKAVVETVEKANFEEYTVTYDANGADSGTVEGQTIRSGFKVKLKSGSTLTKLGYSFAGWGESQNADSSSALQPGSRQTITGNKTYYAIWEENTVTITYLPGVEEGKYTGEMESATPAKDSTTTLIPNAFQRPGYNFTGWQDETGTPIANKATIETTKNYTLTAQWEIIEYTIGYTLNGGTVATANPTKYTVETNDFTLNNPTRAAYSFTGWSGTGLTGNTNTSVKILKGSTGNRTYTANWQKVGAAVTLANNQTVGITSNNLKDYIGTEVKYTCTGGGTWRIFYLDVDNKYGDGNYTLYIKRDFDSSLTFTTAQRGGKISDTSLFAYYRKMNPIDKDTTLATKDNEGIVDCIYLCKPSNWTSYCNSTYATNAYGAASLEMFVDAWNIYKQKNDLTVYRDSGSVCLKRNGVSGGIVIPKSSCKAISIEQGPSSVFATTSGSCVLATEYAGQRNLIYATTSDKTLNVMQGSYLCPIVALK